MPSPKLATPSSTLPPGVSPAISPFLTLPTLTALLAREPHSIPYLQAHVFLLQTSSPEQRDARLALSREYIAVGRMVDAEAELSGVEKELRRDAKGSRQWREAVEGLVEVCNLLGREGRAGQWRRKLAEV